MRSSFDEIRQTLKAAIAWTVIAEIVRRHGANADLRIIEMHPGGGQYDILRLLRVTGSSGLIFDTTSKTIADFNLGSGEFSSPALPGDDRYPWLSHWITNPDPAAAVEAMLPSMGLAPVRGLPSTNRLIFGFRLVAGLLISQMSGKHFVQAKNAFFDTSGEGGGRSELLLQFEKLYQDRSERPKSIDNDEVYHCWLLHQGVDEHLIGCVRMDGLVSAYSSPEIAHDLFPIYRESRKMSSVIAAAAQILNLK